MKLSYQHYRHKGDARRRVPETIRWQKLRIAFINWIGVERTGKFQVLFTISKFGPSRAFARKGLAWSPFQWRRSVGYREPVGCKAIGAIPVLGSNSS
jgi:hypothetical protein